MRGWRGVVKRAAAGRTLEPMSFEPGKAVVVTDPAQLATYGRAFRKTGKRVVLVPLGRRLHAGHISLIRAAKSLLGAIVMVTYNGEDVPEDFAREGVDVVFHGDLSTPVRVVPKHDHLEDPDVIAESITRTIAAINATHATDVVMGEKDFEELVALQQAVSALRMEVLLHSLPTVRAGNGVAMALRNEEVPDSLHDAALALSAALTAGAHAAEHGAEVVLETARGVLDAAGITPDYLELRSLGFGPAPEVGDARLLAAATFGPVRLIDNVGVPVGIGFKNMGDEPGA